MDWISQRGLNLWGAIRAQSAADGQSYVCCTKLCHRQYSGTISFKGSNTLARLSVIWHCMGWHPQPTTIHQTVPDMQVGNTVTCRCQHIVCWEGILSSWAVLFQIQAHCVNPHLHQWWYLWLWHMCMSSSVCQLQDVALPRSFHAEKCAAQLRRSTWNAIAPLSSICPTLLWRGTAQFQGCEFASRKGCFFIYSNSSQFMLY